MDPVVAALYRRYRPEAFAEMIGQSQVTEPLMTALRTGRIGHAYLFSGPRGCGKTTSARILARCLNCVEGPTDTPCGVCPSCVELSRDGGGSLDVVEIDAASHGGVDDARDLRERAVFAPARDRFKIFIIDEAHMVTPGGFNALLKIVEEPPPHVKFVFATTEPDKVIGTIRSRTHHYPFRLIAPGTLIDYVQSLSESEGVQVEPGVLPLVVRAGGGSVRDTLSILDQLIAGSEGDLVTASRAAGLLGFTHAELLDDVVAAFGAHDPAAAFRATDRVVQTGQDPRRFVEDLLERLRDLIVVSATTVDGAAAVFRGVPQDQLTRMFEQSQSFGPGELSRIADVVSAALDRMAGATAPRLQLELMVARALVHAGAAQPQPAQPAQRQAAQPRPAQSQAARAQSAPAQAAPAQPAPQVPASPAQDPLAALAAARSAASEPQAPNAAETAASIREFLREDDSGSASVPPAPPETSAPAPAQKPPAQPVQSASTEDPRPAGETPHPNEGAAGFGRPISAVLSSSQIESIGGDPAPKAQPAPDARGTQASAPPAQQGVPASAPPAPDPADQQPSRPGQTQASPEADVGAQGASATQPASPDAPASDADDPDAADAPQSGFDDLMDLWPELLEEILESDRDAWNAVRVVQPLALDGDVLTVGLASESDLAAFKGVGAGPLRETILGATGVNVKYKPKRVAQSSGTADGRQQGAAREPRPAGADAEEPHQARPTPADDPVERAVARLSALGPALAAPAWADPPPPAPAPMHPQSEETEPQNRAGSTRASDPSVSATPGAVPDSGAEGPDVEGPGAEEPGAEEPGSADLAGERADSNPVEVAATDPAAPAAVPEPGFDPGDYGDSYGDDDPYADAAGDPYLASDDRMDVPQPESTRTEPVSEPALPESSQQFPQQSPQSPPPVRPQPEPAGKPRSAPAFTRYGEAVVREVLGARFIEERPLPPRMEA